MDKIEELKAAKEARKGASRLYRAMGRAFVEGCPELGQLHEGLALAMEAGDEGGVELMQGSIVEVLGTLADVYEKVDNAGKPKLWTPKLVRGGKLSGNKG